MSDDVFNRSKSNKLLMARRYVNDDNVFIFG